MTAHVLFVVGTTATGKSDLAVEIAEELEKRGQPKPEIINADSVSFFDQVEIGAAKPSAELLKRATHHLVGVVKPLEKYTAGDFRRDAVRIIEKGLTKTFIVVGGSGFYVQALEKGMYDVADPSPEIRIAIEHEAATEGFAKLYQELLQRDPETKIQPADHYRTQRALEILRTRPGETMAEIKAAFELSKPRNPFTSSKIGLFRPRDVLRQKVTERTERMMQLGLIDEVQRLREKGLSSWSPMQSVGYKEVQTFLDGQLERAQLEPLIVTSTMQLAKQQSTWFKRDPLTTWFNSDEEWLNAVAKGAELLTLDSPAFKIPP